jgi:hypothetical protein
MVETEKRMMVVGSESMLKEGDVLYFHVLLETGMISTQSTISYDRLSRRASWRARNLATVYIVESECVDGW